MPKSKVMKVAGTITESKSMMQMPCGYENSVRSGAADMYVRMHRKGCAICRASKEKEHVIEIQTAGMKSDSFTLEDTKQKVESIAKNAGMQLDGMDIDAMIASRIAQAKMGASK